MLFPIFAGRKQEFKAITPKISTIMKKHFLFAAVAGLMAFAACDSEETVVPEPPQQEETEQPGDQPEENPEEQPEENPEENPEDQPGEEPNGGVSQSAVSSIIRTDKGEKLLLTGLTGLLEDGESSVWTMAYDNQGRLSLASVTEEDDTEAFKLSYEPFKIEFPEEYRYTDEYDDEHIVTLSGTLNAKGYLASLTVTDDDAATMDERLRYVTTTYLEYDAEDHLVQAKTHYDELGNTTGGPGTGTWTFTWKDGLLTEAAFVAKSVMVEEMEHYYIGYNRDENKYKQNTVGLSEITGTGPLALAGLLGKGPDQFIGYYSYVYKWIVEGNIRERYDECINHMYELNENGTLSTEKSFPAVSGGNGDYEVPMNTYTYSYSPFGSSTTKASAAPAWAKKTTKGRLPFQPRGMAR